MTSKVGATEEYQGGHLARCFDCLIFRYARMFVKCLNSVFLLCLEMFGEWGFVGSWDLSDRLTMSTARADIKQSNSNTEWFTKKKTLQNTVIRSVWRTTYCVSLQASFWSFLEIPCHWWFNTLLEIHNLSKEVEMSKLRYPENMVMRPKYRDVKTVEKRVEKWGSEDVKRVVMSRA